MAIIRFTAIVITNIVRNEPRNPVVATPTDPPRRLNSPPVLTSSNNIIRFSTRVGNTTAVGPINTTFLFPGVDGGVTNAII